jgi:1,4-alpha-glucan branching enzyme
MSNALLEAMAAGVPIICSDNPGTAAVIRHLVNGIKIKPGELEEAAASVCRIFEDPVLATTLADRARADVRARFDISVTAGEYEQLFLRLVSAGVHQCRTG